MFSGPAAGGLGGTSGNWSDQQPERGGTAPGYRVPAGVTSAGSFQPSRDFDAHNLQLLVDTTAPPAAGGRGADCPCFPVSCSSSRGTGQQQRLNQPGRHHRRALSCQGLFPAGHANRILHWQGTTLALPSPPAGGQGVTISGPLRFTNRPTPAQKKTQN